MTTDKEIEAILLKMEQIYGKIYGDNFLGDTGYALEADKAIVNLDSTLAMEMGKIEKATGADKVAKGTEPYKMAKAEMDRTNRELEAAKEQIKFLDKKLQYLKLRYQAENKMLGAA